MEERKKKVVGTNGLISLFSTKSAGEPKGVGKNVFDWTICHKRPVI